MCLQTVEGIFFMFGSMAECVDLEESIYLPMLMNMVPSINFNNITLLSTALYMIGVCYYLDIATLRDRRAIFPSALQDKITLEQDADSFSCMNGHACTHRHMQVHIHTSMHEQRHIPACTPNTHTHTHTHTHTCVCRHV